MENTYRLYGNTARLKVLRPFDPWRSPLCTCMPKYSLHPYTGCSHFCLYCYATAYIGVKPSTPKTEFIKRLKADLRYANRNLPVELSSSSDPYPPLEAWTMLTRETLKTLKEHGMRVIIVTKSNIVARDLDILREIPSIVMVTVTTLNEELSKKLEPGAPAPQKRIETICKLSDSGIPVGARIDPIIPKLNDNEDDIARLVKELASCGVKHIVTSTYKARPDSLRRLCKAFPLHRAYWRKLYLEYGEKIHGYFYLPRQVREEILRKVVEKARIHGISISICREGLRLSNTNTLSCDGQHLFIYHPIHQLQHNNKKDSRGVVKWTKSWNIA